MNPAPSLGELLPRLLRGYAIDTTFGIPGVHTVEMYRGLPDSGLRHVTPRHEQGGGFMEHADRFVQFALPQFEKERKLYLTIAVGCTGGRHRSVAVTEELGKRLAADWDVMVRHRDLMRT